MSDCCRHNFYYSIVSSYSYGAYQIKLTTYKHLTSHEHFLPAKVKPSTELALLTTVFVCSLASYILINNDSKIFNQGNLFSRVISSYVIANWENFRMNLHSGGLKLA